MVTLHVLRSASGLLTSCFGAGVNLGADRVFECGSMIFSPHSLPDSPDALVDIPFLGVFHEGHRCWGSLRDHDVYHVKAQGELFLDRFTPNTSDTVMYNPPLQTSYGIVLGKWGRVYQRYGKSDVFSVGISYWGNNAVYAKSLAVPYSDQVGLRGAIKPYQTLMKYEVKYDGDYGSITFSVGPRILEYTIGEPEHLPPLYFIQFLKRTGEGIGFSAMYYGYEVDGHWGYYFPSGFTSTEDVQVQGQKHGCTFSSYEMSQYKPLRSDQDFDFQIGEIIDTVGSKGFSGFIGSVFSSNPSNANWGELGADILSQQKFVKVNLLLDLVDLIFIVKQLESWRALGKLYKDLMKRGLGTGSMAIAAILSRSWAKLFGKLGLSIDYGVLPPIRDVVEIKKGVERLIQADVHPSTRFHSRTTSQVDGLLDSPILSNCVLTAEVGILPEEFSTAIQTSIQKLTRWGLYPNLQVMWDVIPFSFLIDWIVDFGDTFKSMDRYLEVERFPVFYAILGEKRVWIPSVERVAPCFLGVTGVIAYSCYDRYCSDFLPLPPIKSVDWGTGPVKHWAEALALLVTRKGV